MKLKLFSAGLAGWLLMAQPTFAATVTPAAGADPGEAQVEAVLGPPSIVKRTGPAEYQIDGDKATLYDLLNTTLPEKERALKAMQDNLYQRLQVQNQASAGMSIETKRAQCQKLAVNSIERTRCYQELVALREQQGQSEQSSADERADEEAQMDKLQQQIEAIDEFRKQYSK
jgi:hypothetical protein